MEVEIRERLQASTHTIFICRVVDAAVTDHHPMVYSAGRFFDGGALSPLAEHRTSSWRGRWMSPSNDRAATASTCRTGSSPRCGAASSAASSSPGVNLSEIALAESFGVSRTPVREALKQLQTEGLVDIRPRVGTFVTTPSRREITELFEMKELLEGAAARLLAHRGRVPELDRLEQNLVEADQAAVAATTATGTPSWCRSSTTC